MQDAEDTGTVKDEIVLDKRVFCSKCCIQSSALGDSDLEQIASGLQVSSQLRFLGCHKPVLWFSSGSSFSSIITPSSVLLPEL